jgi:hypothetical protein
MPAPFYQMCTSRCLLDIQPTDWKDLLVHKFRRLQRSRSGARRSARATGSPARARPRAPALRLECSVSATPEVRPQIGDFRTNV